MSWELVLEGVDPRNFNVVASFVAEMLMLSAAYCLSQLYSVLLSRYIRRGNKVDLHALGRIPSDFLESTTVAQQMGYAWPSVLIAILFFSDYFTAIAFAVRNNNNTWQGLIVWSVLTIAVLSFFFF